MARAMTSSCCWTPTTGSRSTRRPSGSCVSAGGQAGSAQVSVDMGTAVMGAEEDGPILDAIPPGRGWRARTVCVGNPHLVLLGAELDGIDVARAGSAAQDAYPGGINLELV